MSLSYVEASVRIDALHDEAHPARWDLCAEHADQLSVPRGWTRDDQRPPAPSADEPDPTPAPATEPAADAGRTEQPSAAAHATPDPADGPPPRTADEDGPAAPPEPSRQPTSAPGRTNRYAALLSCLPQIAASLAAAADRPLEPQNPILPDIPGQLRLPVSDRRAGPPDRTGPNGAGSRTGPDGRSDPTSAGAPDNVVPLVRRGAAGVLDPIG